MMPTSQSNASKLPPRLTTRPFPPYAYVPGMHAHPFSDPAGHSYGVEPKSVDRCDELAIKQAHAWAIDLFNHGYYWESHEAWESLWHAFGRTGPRADFVKGLIKLAAAGVKAREGKVTGVRRHGRRAAELFVACANADGFSSEREFGLSAAWLLEKCRLLSEQPETIVDSTKCDVMRLFPFALAPSFRAAGWQPRER